jgi:hypothetical protein
VGWQFQNGQFRLVLVLKSLGGETAALQREREARALVHEAWFDFSDFHAALGRPTRARGRRAHERPRPDRWPPRAGRPLRNAQRRVAIRGGKTSFGTR